MSRMDKKIENFTEKLESIKKSSGYSRSKKMCA